MRTSIPPLHRVHAAASNLAGDAHTTLNDLCATLEFIETAAGPDTRIASLAHIALVFAQGKADQFEAASIRHHKNARGAA